MYLFPVFAYVSGADIVALDEHWCLTKQGFSTLYRNQLYPLKKDGNE